MRDGGIQMKRMGIAALLLAAATLAPMGAHANAALNFECSNTMAAGGAATCAVNFNLADGRAIALLDTGANFDDLLARGPLTMVWTDSTGKTVAAYGCFGSGIPMQGTLADTRVGLCTQYGPLANSYKPGAQTITVSAWNTFCPGSSCTFHGRLHLADPSDLLNP